MRRLAAVLAVLLLLTACGDDAEPTADTSPSPTTDAATDDDGATSEDGEAGAADEPTEDDDAEGDGAGEDDADEEDPGATTTTAYFARADDSGIWVEPASEELDEPTLAVARSAMELLVAGEPADPNVETLAPDGTEVLDVDIDGDTLTVDLSGAVQDGNVGGAGEEAFAQQLAHTGAQFDGVEQVRLLVDGQEVEELWGHLDWSQPIEPDPFALSPITFETHEWGEEVPAGEVTVGGQANTFEATVELRLIGPHGDVVEETFTTATSGTGERGTWEHTFSLEGAGTWTIEAIEPDPSDGEGRPPFTTTLELRSS